jgi:hypothetical protein
MKLSNVFNSILFSLILTIFPILSHKAIAVELKPSEPNTMASEDNQFTLNSFKVKKCGNNEVSVKSKKSVILKCFEGNKEVISQLEKLGDDFWTKFNLQQILYIANVIGKYPVIHKTSYSNNKPIYRNDKNGELELLSSNHITEIVNDCSKNLINILSLKNNNFLSTDKAIEGNYTYLAMTEKYQKGLSFLGNVKDANIIFAYYFRHNLEVKETFEFNPKVKYNVESSNVVFIQQNPKIVFKGFENQLKFQSNLMNNYVLINIINEMKKLNYQNSDNFTRKDLLLKVVSNYVTESNAYLNSSSSEKEIILNNAKNYFQDLISKKTSLNDLELIYKRNTAWLMINNEINSNRLYNNRVQSPIGKVAYGEANYHTFMILSVTNGKTYILQGDGANPAFPYEITTIDKVLNNADRVVTFKH